LLVGDLSAERDFTDVRDIVRGYRLVAEKGESGAVYNLGSGRAQSIRAIVEYYVAHARVPIRVEPDPARLRPAEVPRTLCDASLARDRLGWRPAIDFDDSLGAILEHWRAAVASRGE
jgi:GDP-4-dehydro-6-deoxy-D-mannose reductase